MDECDGKRSDVLIVYHGNCNDGFCAAWVANKAFPQAEFFPAIHDMAMPDVTGRDVFLLDFAFKRPVLLALKEKAKRITVLDHHETAAADLEGVKDCFFDMRKSGGRIAWDYFSPMFLRQERPWLVDYTEDRDLRHWNLPHSREVNAAISSFKRDFKTWDHLAKLYSAHDLTSSHCPLVFDGAAIARYEEQQFRTIIEHAREVMLDSHQVLAANTSINPNDISLKLAKNRLFGIAWYLREDGKYVYSLSSEPNGIHVGDIAKKHGGGGHRHSAGFASDDFVLQEIGNQAA